mgnify:CR=1 FL=1
MDKNLMVLLKHTKVFKDFEWEIKDKNGKILALAESPFYKDLTTDIFLRDNKDNFVRMHQDKGHKSGSYKGSIKNKSSYFLFDKDNMGVGEISIKTKGRFPRAYIYYQMSYNYEVYDCYLVVPPRQGLNLCVYHGDSLLSIIRKNAITKNRQDSFLMYIKSSEALIISSMFGLFHDMQENHYDLRNRMDVHGGHSAQGYFKTKNKELLSKYNHEFVKSIHKYNED